MCKRAACDSCRMSPSIFLTRTLTSATLYLYLNLTSATLYLYLNLTS
jgi:hypothetical protein